jgi:hypothetical protein
MSFRALLELSFSIYGLFLIKLECSKSETSK